MGWFIRIQSTLEISQASNLWRWSLFWTPACLWQERSGTTPTAASRKPLPATYWGPPVVEDESFLSRALSHVPPVTFTFHPQFPNFSFLPKMDVWNNFSKHDLLHFRWHNSKPSTHLSVCWIEGHCSSQHQNKDHTCCYCVGWAQKCFHTDSGIKFVEIPTFLAASFNDGWQYHSANQCSYAHANEKEGQPGNIGGSVLVLACRGTRWRSKIRSVPESFLLYFK